MDARRRPLTLLVLAPLLGLCALSLGACDAGRSASAGSRAAALPVTAPIRTPQPTPNALVLSVDPQASGQPLNRQVLGQNLQWVDRGDEMFTDQGTLRPEMLALAQDMTPTVLRYPGGLQSDAYHWQQGMGVQGERGNNLHANAGTLQKTIVGTREFLELCEALQAQPLITVNIPTGTAEEAAAWVRQVNIDGLVSSRTGRRLPRVQWWELGNEPYLQPQELKSAWMRPDDFSQKARLVAQAMRAVDPHIQLILPLTSDARNGLTATPMPGFSRQVLSTSFDAASRPDAVALHDAYVPGAPEGYSLDQLYWGAMAGSRGVQTDLAAMQTLLHDQGLSVPLAITEFNSLFTLSNPETDTLVLSPAGALALADVLRVLATRTDIVMANFWSLSGNGFFGAMRATDAGHAQARPAYEVLRLMSQALAGQALPSTLAAPSVDTPSVGYTAAVQGLPLAEALVTRDTTGGTHTLRILLIHKDPVNAATLQLSLPGPDIWRSVQAARLSVLQATDVFDRSDAPGVFARIDRVLFDAPRPDAQQVLGQLPLPAASVSLLTLTLQP